MSVSMSQLCVPAFTQGLDALSAVLEKAEAHAAERKIDQAAFLQARLFPDMFALARQVQITTDHAKGAVARLAGQEVPRFADDEADFAALRARLAKTLDLIASIPPDAIDGSEEREIEFTAGPRTMRFWGKDYLTSWALPNFYFHLSMAYGLLRHNGLPLGKRDFMGAVRFR